MPYMHTPMDCTKLNCSSLPHTFPALHPPGSPHTVNAWLGPIPTVTPLHHDPDHNLLTQVVGAKYVRLYGAECTEVLAPHKEGLCTNSSSIDLDAFASAAELEGRFPGAGRLPYWDCLLTPGQMVSNVRFCGLD